MISYSRFAEIINYFEKEEQFADNFRNLLYKYDKREFIDPYCFENTTANEYIIFLLEHIFCDKSHWISYFIYDLDCGKGWKPGTIIDSFGNDIKLKTVQDLWKLLQENMNDNN